MSGPYSSDSTVLKRSLYFLVDKHLPFDESPWKWSPQTLGTHWSPLQSKCTFKPNSYTLIIFCSKSIWLVTSFSTLSSLLRLRWICFCCCFWLIFDDYLRWHWWSGVNDQVMREGLKSQSQNDQAYIAWIQKNQPPPPPTLAILPRCQPWWWGWLVWTALEGFPSSSPASSLGGSGCWLWWCISYSLCISYWCWLLILSIVLMLMLMLMLMILLILMQKLFFPCSCILAGLTSAPFTLVFALIGKAASSIVFLTGFSSSSSQS